MPDLRFEKILIVLPKQKEELEDVVRDVLDETTKSGGPPVVMHNEADAIAEARKGFSLIITHIELPPDRKAALDTTAHRGLALVQSLRKEADSRIGRTPVVILAEAIASTVDDEIEGIDRCETARLGLGSVEMAGPADDGAASGFEAELRQALAALSNGRPTEPIDVEIEFRLAEQQDRPEQLWTIKTVRGVNHFEPASGSSQFNIKRLQDLARDANTFDPKKIHQDDYPLWERKLRRIGNQLRKELFADPGFERAFNKARRRAGGMRNMAIRFTVLEELHPVLLEALVEDGQNTPFWMEEASVCRRLRTRKGKVVTVPAVPGRPINALIIESDLGPGASHRLVGALRPLTNVALESEKLFQLLTERAQRAPPGAFSAPVRITAATVRSGNTSFREALQRQLAVGTWDLVHLGGHHYLDAEGRKGGFFTPGNAPGTVDCIPLNDIATWLSKAQTRLVYLSSCHSSSDQTILALAEAVPAIVGFRWDIPDDQAISFTTMFYDELLNRSGSLRAAFQAARLALCGSELDRRKQAWAASMLVLEPDDFVLQPGEKTPGAEAPATVTG